MRRFRTQHSTGTPTLLHEPYATTTTYSVLYWHTKHCYIHYTMLLHTQYSAHRPLCSIPKHLIWFRNVIPTLNHYSQKHMSASHLEAHLKCEASHKDEVTDDNDISQAG